MPTKTTNLEIIPKFVKSCIQTLTPLGEQPLLTLGAEMDAMGVKAVDKGQSHHYEETVDIMCASQWLSAHISQGCHHWQKHHWPLPGDVLVWTEQSLRETEWRDDIASNDDKVCHFETFTKSFRLQHASTVSCTEVARGVSTDGLHQCITMRRRYQWQSQL